MDRVAQWAQKQNIATKTLAVLACAASIPCWAQNPASSNDSQRDRVVLVSLVDRKLAVIDNGVVIATFQVAVGAKVSPSPAGEFTIVSHVANPTYYRRGTVIPTGKDNPVGTRWVGLNLKGYGIHGTNAPKSIGARHRMDASACATAIWSSCSRCCRSETRFGFAASATSKLRRSSAERRSRWW
jgi:lipoprotein-anchoring transpeptidase ErfK/SrfK